MDRPADASSSTKARSPSSALAPLPAASIEPAATCPVAIHASEMMSAALSALLGCVGKQLY